MGYSDYRSTIIKDDDGYTALIDRTGTRLAESTSAPEDVIKSALDRGGSVNFRGNGDIASPLVHTLSTGLTAMTGLRIKSKTEIHFESGVELLIPNGYADGVFVLDTTYNGETIKDVKMTGSKLIIKEAGPTQQQDFTALLVRLSLAAKGVSYCDIGRLHVHHALNGFAVDQQVTGGWFTSNTVQDMTFYFFVNGCNFINTAAVAQMSNSTNTFEKIDMQMDATTLYGWKNIDGNNCEFDNCAVWDQHNGTPGAFKVSQWAASATNMRVKGGIMLNDPSTYEMLCAPNEVRFDAGHSNVPLIGDSYTYTTTIPGVAGQMTYQLPHGMSGAPLTLKSVIPRSKDALGVPFIPTIGATYILLTCTDKPFPPSRPSNVNNLSFTVTVGSKVAH